MLPLRRHVLVALAVLAVSAPIGAQAGPRFAISFAKSAHAGPITGRVYVAISRVSDTSGTPIRRAGENGDPLFGRNVESLAAGQTAIIDASAFGHPVQSLSNIP